MPWLMELWEWLIVVDFAVLAVMLLAVLLLDLMEWLLFALHACFAVLAAMVVAVLMFDLMVWRLVMLVVDFAVLAVMMAAAPSLVSAGLMLLLVTAMLLGFPGWTCPEVVTCLPPTRIGAGNPPTDYLAAREKLG